LDYLFAELDDAPSDLVEGPLTGAQSERRNETFGGWHRLHRCRRSLHHLGVVVADVQAACLFTGGERTRRLAQPAAFIVFHELELLEHRERVRRFVPFDRRKHDLCYPVWISTKLAQ